MTKTPKRPRDVSQLAKMMVDIASGDDDQPMPRSSTVAKRKKSKPAKRLAVKKLNER